MPSVGNSIEIFVCMAQWHLISCCSSVSADLFLHLHLFIEFNYTSNPDANLLLLRAEGGEGGVGRLTPCEVSRDSEEPGK